MMAKKTKTDTWFDDLVGEVGNVADSLGQVAATGWPAWPTGHPYFDFLTEIGGFPKGRTVELFGEPSSGKSTLATMAAGRAMQQGKTVIYIDFEDTFDPGWAKTLGLDISKGNFLLVNPRHREAGFDIIETALKKDKNKNIAMIIWDSVGGSSIKEVVEATEAKAEMGLRMAQVMGAGMGRIDTAMKDYPTDACIVFINQVRVNFRGHIVTKDTPGGNKFKHAMSMRIGVQPTKKLTVEDTDSFTAKSAKKEIGRNLKVWMEKTKFGSRGAQVPLVFRNNLGFDIIQSICETAVARKLFKPAGGSWVEIGPEFTAGEPRKVNGKGQVSAYFRENPESFGRLQEQVLALLYDDRAAALKREKESFYTEDDILMENIAGADTGDIE